MGFFDEVMRLFYSFLLLFAISAHSQEQAVSELKDGKMTYGIGLGFVVSPGYMIFKRLPVWSGATDGST